MEGKCRVSVCYIVQMYSISAYESRIQSFEYHFVIVISSWVTFTVYAVMRLPELWISATTIIFFLTGCRSGGLVQLTWELVNTGWLLAAHKLVSSVGFAVSACRLGPAAPRRKSNAHVANGVNMMRANMAHLLREDGFGIIGLAHLPSFSPAGPSATSLLQFKANYFAGDYYGMRLLTISHLHGNVSLSPSFSCSRFLCVCLSHRPHRCVSACDLRCAHKETTVECVRTYTHACTR